MGQKLQTQFNLNIKKIRHVVMKMIATTIAVTTLSLAILLVIVGIGAKSEPLIFQSANAQVSVFPGTQPEPPSTGSSGGTAGGTAGGPSSGPTGGTGAPGFNAKAISEQNSIQTDADVKNLVILVPNKKLVDQAFLPLEATVVQGTNVIWVNGDPAASHGVVVKGNTGQSVFSNQTIPYKNGTQFTFDTIGKYTFSDPTSPASTTGTINVVSPQNAPDNGSTNSTMPTAGLFVVPAGDKAYFDKHFSTLGYHAADSNIIKQTGTNQGNDIDLYVYIQKSGKYDTILHRTAVKLGFLQSKTG
jgi:plastocyanin